MKELRRFIWYLVSRLLIAVMVLGLSIVVFYYAMNATNIYIVLKDGMAKRAQVIMMDEDDRELVKFFDENYILSDENIQNSLKNQSSYEWYIIRGIDHRLTMTWMWAWPWENVAKVEFVETIPRIDGRLDQGFKQVAENFYGEGYNSPPKWPGGRYSAKMEKKNNRWYIRSLSYLGAVTAEVERE